MRLATESTERPAPSELSGAAESLDDALVAVEQCLRKRLDSATPYPPELSARLINAGGKRIRPLLLLATFESVRATFGTSQQIRNDDLHQLGAVAELVHTATLFHDDVIDHSIERRGMPSAQVLHGNKIAILVGDFVYAEAFARLMERAFLYPSQRLAVTIQQLVEGEILQHEIVSSRNFKAGQLLDVAKLKTASLFAWCSETGAWATGRTDLLTSAFDFGHQLGLAFQLIDDVLDTLAAAKNLTPEFCAEFLASAPSFPLMLLFENSPRHFDLWRRLPELSESARLGAIGELVEGCKGAHVIGRSHERISNLLHLATGLAKNLGDSPTLRELIAQLQLRATCALEGKALV